MTREEEKFYFDDDTPFTKQDCLGCYEYRKLKRENEALQGQVDYLRRSIERKEEQIADWQDEAILAKSKIDETVDLLGYVNNGEICDNITILANKLLEILERTDK